MCLMGVKLGQSCVLGIVDNFEAEIENPCPVAGQCCIPVCKTFVLLLSPLNFH